MVGACVVFLVCVFFSTCCSRVEGGRYDPSKVAPLGEPPRRIFDKGGIIEYNGYKAKKYEVTTEDGYILGVTRILKAEGGPPVLFVNGWGISPILWLLHGSGHDLPYVLADLGYDCWIGGTRGMEESEKHTNQHITSEEYWDFSHDEIGVYDLPAMIDLMRKETGYNQIFFVGVSLAGTYLTAMCNDRPEYCSYLAANVLFAPGMYVPKQSDFSPNRNLIIVRLPLAAMNLLKTFQLANIEGVGLFSETFLSLCNHHKIVQRFTSLAFKEFFNMYEEHFAPGWLCPTTAHLKWSTSFKQLKHVYQLFKSGGLQKYDYGEEKNLELYGSSKPPSYNLSKIISPTLVCIAENDQLVPIGIMKRQLKELGNVKSVIEISDPTYGHLDFNFGKDIHKYLFSDIVDFLDNISGMK